MCDSVLLLFECDSFGTLPSGESTRFPHGSQGVARFGRMHSHRFSNWDRRALIGRSTIWIRIGPRGLRVGLVGRRHPRWCAWTASGCSDLLCRSAWPSFLERVVNSSRSHVHHRDCYVHAPECHDTNLHTHSDNNCRRSYAIQVVLPANCRKIPITLICLPGGDLSEMAW
jgi:hypothetical protein